jgi:hypothetical protein
MSIRSGVNTERWIIVIGTVLSRALHVVDASALDPVPAQEPNLANLLLAHAAQEDPDRSQ